MVDPLAEAALEVLTRRVEYGNDSRKRAEELFGLDTMTEKYLKALIG